MLRKYLVEITILLVGAFTMMFEIVGSRIIGPYLGTSVYVWTSNIGVIFASLSLGYWLGGRLSVNRANYLYLGGMLVLAAFFVFITAIANVYILDRIIKYIPGFKLRTVISAIVLFAPASVFFGMVLPYGIKLKMQNMAHSGVTVGRIYALSTFGSIIGTFSAGYLLLPELGHTNVQLAISICLFLLAAIILLQAHKWIFSMIPSLLLMITALTMNYKHNKVKDFIDEDTQYNRVLIYNTTDKNTNRPIRMLRINNESSSAMFLDDDNDLVFEVLKYYRLVDYFVPGFEKTLMIGGSGYAYPKDYLQQHPHATIDVVEIDPGLTELAGRYFDLPDDPRLSIIHEDGRTFINRSNKTYDAIFMDAYKSMLTVPFQLTTIEAVQHLRNMLSDNGAVFANIISSLSEENNQFLRAEVATYQKVFPHVYLFAVQYPNPTDKEKGFFQNIMLVAMKSAQPFDFTSPDPELDDYLRHKVTLKGVDKSQILTDEYAPVEYYASKVLD
ncbi:MAG TPA: fused MFS/spermidine synthase [Bacteroidales bacterium]|nr:fused MFS/spermidine synthase [Bacteroidales bacterium]HRX97218.1 fused MFS/spermidine synthase [Bacteroidales bacterium]